MGLLKWIKLNPAAITAGIVAIANFLISYGVPLSQDQAAYFAIAAGALVTIIGAASTRPVNISTVVAAVATIAGGLSAFHFSLSGDQIANGATLLTLVLGVLFHFANIPVAAWKQGTDATSLARRAAAGR